MLLCHVCVSIVCCVLVDEFWDYEEQVDLEAFSASTFYDILLRHSVSVTARLGQLRGEVRIHTQTHTHSTTHTHTHTHRHTDTHRDAHTRRTTPRPQHTNRTH